MRQKSSIFTARAALLSLLVVGSVQVAPASAQSFTDKLKGLFGGDSKPQEQQQAPSGDPDEPRATSDCPQVTIRAGASTYAVAAPGKQAVGNDVRYQITITKLARECTRIGGDVTVHIGVQGRIIVGPSGAPPTIDVPLRMAVVQGGVGEKVITTKAYRTTVNLGEDESVPFSFVADDLVYPVPPPSVADNYIFYVGFDPQLVSTSDKPAKSGRK